MLIISINWSIEYVDQLIRTWLEQLYNIEIIIYTYII